jgi:hypothetical protein
MGGMDMIDEMIEDLGQNHGMSFRKIKRLRDNESLLLCNKMPRSWM